MDATTHNKVICRAIDYIYKNANPDNKRNSIAIVEELKLLKKRPLPMTTLEKLTEKANSSFGSKVRMPSIAAIEILLTEKGIEFESRSSTNVVEHRSNGNRYVNSRYDGKEGKLLEIKLSDDEAKKLGFYVLRLDTSDSYYSYNTSGYARDLVDLINLKSK